MQLTQLAKVAKVDPWDFKRDTKKLKANDIVGKANQSVREELKKFRLQKKGLSSGHTHKHNFQCKLVSKMYVLNELRKDIREIKADMKKKNKL